MSARESLRSKGDRKGASQPSVVGATVREASSRVTGRRLPKGGIREQDRLKVAEGALPDSTTIGPSSGKESLGRTLRVVAVMSGLLLVVLIAVGIATLILANTGAFAVSSVEAYDSEHITADDIARLANIGDDVTLLNIDVEAIEANVKKNPWVKSVEIERVFPDTLRLRVNERRLGAVVAMSSGGVAWLMGDDNVWIEPLKFEVSESESTNDAALAKASDLGVILIADVPNSVNPAACYECSDGAIQAVMSVAAQLSDSFKERVVCYSASSEDDISITLKNGVEVSFGSDENIALKESVAERILQEYAGQVTYINVRIPSRPTYRRVDSEYVREGTGANGSATDEESVVPKVKAREDDEEESNDDEAKANSSSDASSDGTSESSNSGESEQSNASEGDYSSYEYGYDTTSDYGYDYGYDSYDYGYDSSNNGYDSYDYGYDSTYNYGY